LWDLSSRKEIVKLEGETAGILSFTRSVAMSANGGTVAVATAGGKVVKLWEVSTRKELAGIPSFKTPVTALALSPDGSILAVVEWVDLVASSYPITFWDTRTGQSLGKLVGQECSVKCLEFSPDGRMLASAGHDGKIRLWNVTARAGSRQ